MGILRIKELLGFKDKKYGWNDLDNSIKTEAIKKISLAVVIFFLAFCYLIYTKAWLESLAIIAVSAYFALAACKYLMTFYYGAYVLIIGECVELDQQEKTIAKIKKYIGKCRMVIKADDFFINIPISYSSKYRTGSRYAVYVDEKNVYQKDSDYYQVINPLAISTISHKGSFPSGKEKAP